MKVHNIVDKKQILGGIIIILVMLMYSSNYFNNTFPYSEGWFINYVELIEQGKIPYKDFYYYLPPLNLVIDWLFWKLSFGYLIVFRAWYLFERTVLYLLVYHLLSKQFEWKKAAVACCFAEIICTGDAFDLFGDYNQNIAVLTVFLVYCAVRFSESDEGKEKRKSLLYAGVVLGLLFLCKQTIFIAALSIYFVVLTILCILKKDKEYIRYIISTIIGLLIPVLLCASYLIYHNALWDFMDQVFISVDGKGSIFDIIIFTPLKVLTNWSCWIMAIVLILILKISKDMQCKNDNRNIYIIGLLAVAVLYVIDKCTLPVIIQYVKAYFESWKFLLMVVVFAMPLLITVIFRNKIVQYQKKIYFGIIILSIGIFVASILSSEYYEAVYDVGMFGLISKYFNVIGYYFLILLVIICFIRKVKISNEMVDSKNDTMIMFASGGIVLCYAAVMAAGGTSMPSLAMRISTPLILTIILSEGMVENASKYLKFLVMGVCLIITTVCISQKSISPYPWWGMNDYPKEEKIYTVDIKELKGFLFSQEDKEMYENISRLINENSDEDDIVFGYPYIKIYNILCKRYTSYFVPVVWYDVVGDKYVDMLLNELQENPPKIVVWKNIPGALETHEAVYRDGKLLEQRKIEAMFKKMLPTKYKLLGEYNEVKVYKLIE